MAGILCNLMEPKGERQPATASRSHSERIARDQEHPKSSPGLLRRLGHRVLRMLRQTPPGPKPIEPNFSNKLPPELWLSILELLPPVAATSLALTCRSMYDQYGERPCSILKLPEYKQDKLELLSYLDAHLPKHRLCHSCAVFHCRKSPSTEQRNFEGSYDSWPCGLTQGRSSFFLGYALIWPWLASVMRASRFGSEYGMSVDGLARASGRKNNWNDRVEPSIVDGRLLMKVQSTLVVDRNTEIPFAMGVHRYTCYSHAGCLYDIVECALSHPQPEAPKLDCLRECACKALRRCPDCPTEFLVETKNFGDISDDIRQAVEARDIQDVLVLTKWIDYGEGKSPLSPEWQALSRHNDLCSSEPIGTRDIKDIRWRFEKSVGNYDYLPVREIERKRDRGVGNFSGSDTPTRIQLECTLQ